MNALLAGTTLIITINAIAFTGMHFMVKGLERHYSKKFR